MACEKHYQHKHKCRMLAGEQHHWNPWKSCRWTGMHEFTGLNKISKHILPLIAENVPNILVSLICYQASITEDLFLYWFNYLHNKHIVHDTTASLLWANTEFSGKAIFKFTWKNTWTQASFEENASGYCLPVLVIQSIMSQGWSGFYLENKKFTTEFKSESTITVSLFPK